MEKVTSQMGTTFYIVSAPMKKAETLAEYTARIMREEDISAYKVERRAKKEAEARGLEETHRCSDATVGNVLLDKTGNIGIYTLMALAWGLNRPVEEIIAAAFELPTRNSAFGESEIARMWEVHQNLPAEDKKYFNRRLEELLRDMQSVKKQKK